MNFTYTLFSPEDGEWGAPKDNGHWSGMVGMLESGEVDIAVTDLTYTVPRTAVLTFVTPLELSYHTLFIKNPSESYNFLAYVDPLQWMSWTFIGVYVLIIPLFLGLTTRYNVLQLPFDLWNQYNHE